MQRRPDESYIEAEARQAALTASEAAAQGNYGSNLSQSLYGNTGGITSKQIYEQGPGRKCSSSFRSFNGNIGNT